MLELNSNTCLWLDSSLSTGSGSQIASIDSILLQVGQLVRDHMRKHPYPKEPLPDDGMEFFDSGSESDDSGLADLIGHESS